jgi:hypothetical protein
MDTAIRGPGGLSLTKLGSTPVSDGPNSSFQTKYEILFDVPIKTTYLPCEGKHTPKAKNRNTIIYSYDDLPMHITKIKIKKNIFDYKFLLKSGIEYNPGPPKSENKTDPPIEENLNVEDDYSAFSDNLINDMKESAAHSRKVFAPKNKIKTKGKNTNNYDKNETYYEYDFLTNLNYQARKGVIKKHDLDRIQRVSSEELQKFADEQSEDINVLCPQKKLSIITSKINVLEYPFLIVINKYGRLCTNYGSTDLQQTGSWKSKSAPLNQAQFIPKDEYRNNSKECKKAPFLPQPILQPPSTVPVEIASNVLKLPPKIRIPGDGDLELIDAKILNDLPILKSFTCKDSDNLLTSQLVISNKPLWACLAYSIYKTIMFANYTINIKAGLVDDWACSFYLARWLVHTREVKYVALFTVGLLYLKTLVFTPTWTLEPGQAEASHNTEDVRPDSQTKTDLKHNRALYRKWTVSKTYEVDGTTMNFSNIPYFKTEPVTIEPIRFRFIKKTFNFFAKIFNNTIIKGYNYLFSGYHKQEILCSDELLFQLSSPDTVNSTHSPQTALARISSKATSLNTVNVHKALPLTNNQVYNGAILIAMCYYYKQREIFINLKMCGPVTTGLSI